MKRTRNRLPLAILTGMLLIMMNVGILRAQGGNLLQNPGFEGGFATVSGDQPRSVANGWVPWHAPRTEGMPSFQNTQPKYIAASAANAQGITPRIRSGVDAQIYYSFFETHDGGLYQQVTVPANAEVRFSIYAHVWSSTFEDANVSDDPGDVALRVGIDPTGGTDPLASSVVYSDAAIFYDTFRQYSIIARAQGTSVTVFVRSTVGEPVQNSYIFLDDAELAVTGGAVVPTNTVAAPTNTVPAPTNTPVPSTGATATTPPIVVASDTPQGGEEATPTPEGGNNPGTLPTATPITLATSTTAPAGPTATPRIPIGGPVTDQFPGRIIHQVSSGDTVGRLAGLYGSSVEAIISANGLNNNAFIRVGQNLIVPVRLPNPATETPAPIPPTVAGAPTAVPGTGGPITGGTQRYVVQRGDSLSGLARRFNTTLGALAQLNGITNPNLIFAGQTLIVPGGSTGGPVVVPTSPAVVVTATPVVIIVVPSPVVVTATPVGGANPGTYVVVPGDNLYRISVRFNVSMTKLASANNITNFDLVFAGQTLVIPQ